MITVTWTVSHSLEMREWSCANLSRGEGVSFLLFISFYVQLCGCWETLVWVALMVMSPGVGGCISEDGYAKVSHLNYIFNY